MDIFKKWKDYLKRKVTTSNFFFSFSLLFIHQLSHHVIAAWHTFIPAGERNQDLKSSPVSLDNMNQNIAASLSFAAAEVIFDHCLGPNHSSLQPLPPLATCSPHIQGNVEAHGRRAALKDKYQGYQGIHLQNNPLLWISVFHWGDSSLE